MFDNQIICLMWRGFVLNDAMKKSLFRTSCQMVLVGEKKRIVKGDGFEGTIRTQLKPVLLVTTGGIQFTADVESDLGQARISYIVRHGDIAEMRRLAELADDEMHVETAPITSGDNSPGPAPPFSNN